MIQQDTKTVIKEGFLDGGEQITLSLQQCIKSQPIPHEIHPKRGLWLSVVD